MDARIILGGQAPDILGAMDRGRVAAEGQINLNRTNALAELYRTQGPGIAAGDQGSLNALAQFDPMAAQGVQQNLLGLEQSRQNLAFSAEEMQMKRDAGKRMAEEALAAQAASLTAEQLAAEKEQITKGLSGAAFFYQNKDKAGYEKFLSENGMDPVEFPFEAFPAHAAMFEGALEAMSTFAPPAPPTPMSPEGKLAADAAAGFVPAGTVKTPDTVINMGEGDKFYEALDKGQAEMFQTLMTDGVQAGRTNGLVDRLDQLLQETPTGGVAAFTRLAGEVGIDIGGLGDVQAVEALINQIVPQQRQPGSGPMSDADLALFKRSVPRLINTPEGNAKIVETMRGINQYVMQQAEIADAVANREITPAEGRKMLKALANPLEGFSSGSGGGDGGAAPPTGGNKTSSGVSWSIAE
jgi:hypothetical protein